MRGRDSQNDEVVVVTGASAGVGRAAAVAFARRGARVGLIARGREGLEGARREVEAAGGTALVYEADVSNYEAIEAAARMFEETLGPIDIWVNDAMVSVFSPIREMQPDEYRRVIEVNYLGYVHGTLVALQHMLPRNQGTIVQVGSALSYRGIPLQSAYCASKHAIQGFNDSLRSELHHDGSRIHLTSVTLPAVNTPQFLWSKSRMPRKPQPVPPIFDPEVAAEAIVWAAYHRRREVTVGLSSVKTKLANTVIPGFVDRYLGKSAYEAQMTNEPDDPGRPNNLWEPVQRDFGADGPFTSRAKPRSLQLWASLHRGAIASSVLAISLVIGVASALRGR